MPLKNDIPEYGTWSREMLDFEPPPRFSTDLREAIMTPPLFAEFSASAFHDAVSAVRGKDEHPPWALQRYLEIRSDWEQNCVIDGVPTTSELAAEHEKAARQAPEAL